MANNPPYKILIDNKPHDHPNQFITGAELRVLGVIPANFGIWLKSKGSEADLPISDSDSIDLLPPGREHFFSGPTATTEG